MYLKTFSENNHLIQNIIYALNAEVLMFIIIKQVNNINVKLVDSYWKIK